MMQIDELRDELTTLADEIEPLAGDVRSLHRRQRRRRIASSSLVVALAAVVAVSTIVVLSRRDNGHVRVTGAGPKEVSAAALSHFDAIVVPATPAVQGVLDSSPLVARYARIPHALRGSNLLLPIPRVALCALESSDAFAVQASTPAPGFTAALTPRLPGGAALYDVSGAFGHDLEVFLKLKTSNLQANAIRARIEADPSVGSFRYVSQADAYAIFTKDFADQPALVQSTKPTDLPASFRIDVSAGVSLETTAQRYRQLDGVAIVVVNGAQRLFGPTLGTPTSACTKPSP
jgi:FtsX extracellular domain